MKKQIPLLLAGILTLVSPLAAGRYAGDFMMIGAGVRALGMGGAFTALADDGTAIYWNPSGIAQINKRSEIMAMQAFLYNGLASYQNLNYCQPLPNDVTLGLNYTRLGVSDIPYFNESYLLGTNVDQRINNSAYHLPGIPDGSFTSVDQLYQFAFAKHLHYDVNLGWMFYDIPVDISLGGGVKFIRRTILKNQGSGTGLDFGFKVRTDLGVIFDLDELGTIDYGMNFQDIAGTQIGWDTTSEHRDEVLFNTKLGIAVTQPVDILNSDLVFAYDYDYVYQGSSHYGVEWNTYTGPLDTRPVVTDGEEGKIKRLDKDNSRYRISLRAGYHSKNLSFGGSIYFNNTVGVDYAMVTNPIGLTHRIGLWVAVDLFNLNNQPGPGLAQGD